MCIVAANVSIEYKLMPNRAWALALYFCPLVAGPPYFAHFKLQLLLMYFMGLRTICYAGTFHTLSKNSREKNYATGTYAV